MELDRRSHTPKGRLARERILRVAERLFAQRGFHGTSMRDVADACSIPLASIVYHFSKKERLYAAVLEAIAAELLAEMTRAIEGPRAVPSPADDRVARLDEMMRVLVRWSRRRPDRVRLVVRELLDNEARVAKAQKLPLAPFLESFAAFIRDGARDGAFATDFPEVAVLHLVGAVSYFVVSQPTVRRIVDKERFGQMNAGYEAEAMKLARRTLRVVPSPSTNARKIEKRGRSGRHET